MKRGQITVFIIVGVVVLFVIAFSTYLFSALQKPQVSVSTTEQNEVRVCLEQAAEQAVEDVLLRGGLGAQSEFTAEQLRIAVRQGAPVALTEQPKYFGIMNLQPLCLARGPNRPNAGLNNLNSCMRGTYQVFEPDTEVLQHILASATQHNLLQAGCANETVTVTFGGDDITVRSESATARLPVQFKRLYNAAYMVMQQEVSNATFDMTRVAALPSCAEPTNGNDCLLPGMLVTADTTAPYTVVTVRDTARLLRGQPTVFRFAVENRYPALLSGPTSISAADGTTQDTSFTFIDPDEDPVTLTCTGAAWAQCPAVNTAVRPHQFIVRLTPACTAPTGTLTITLCDDQGSCSANDIALTVTGC